MLHCITQAALGRLGTDLHGRRDLRQRHARFVLQQEGLALAVGQCFHQRKQSLDAVPQVGQSTRIAISRSIGGDQFVDILALPGT